MNNTYENKKRFNIVDAMIILGILLIAASIIFRTQIIILLNSDTTKNEYTITFEAESVDNAFAGLIKNESEVTWIENGVSLGTLEAVSKPSNALIYSTDENGAISFVESETSSKVTGRLSVKAISNNGCYIDGTHFIAAGMTVTLATKDVQFTAVITSVTSE